MRWEKHPNLTTAIDWLPVLLIVIFRCFGLQVASDMEYVTLLLVYGIWRWTIVCWSRPFQLVMFPTSMESNGSTFTCNEKTSWLAAWCICTYMLLLHFHEACSCGGLSDRWGCESFTTNQMQLLTEATAPVSLCGNQHRWNIIML